MKPLKTDRMTAEARLSEAAAIVAEGIMHLKYNQKTEKIHWISRQTNALMVEKQPEE